jgi:hypothetical protein
MAATGNRKHRFGHHILNDFTHQRERHWQCWHDILLGYSQMLCAVVREMT